MDTLVLFVSAACAAFILVGLWGRENRRHQARLDGLQVRVHVNGIRGKSSVTRLIAGALREDGISTIAKTTGTAAVVIAADGSEDPIERRAAASILEQIDVIERHVTPETQALVIECMALKPAYQEFAERKMVRSTIGVITNVREDHQDVMGETLPEIARSLMNSCPTDGILVTAEQDPEILGVMRAEAERRNTRLIVVDINAVSEAEADAFPYLSFRDNIAVALQVAALAGVPRDVAMRGMLSAAPDPGVTRLSRKLVGRKHVTWANLFAVNDRESTVSTFGKIAAEAVGATRVAILNNRADRGRRVLQFADIAARDLDVDYVITFGAYERQATTRLLENGFARERILNLGDDTSPSLEEILTALQHIPGDELLLAGLVNIHTPQAELLIEYFEHGSHQPTPTHTPASFRRQAKLTFEAA
ncbi:MAG: poly-gamma-glutamate synthase PgsB [bacterium]